MRPSVRSWEEWGRNATEVHLAHFFDSVRSRKSPVEDALMGHRAASCAHIINESIKREAPVNWDFEKERLKT